MADLRVSINGEDNASRAFQSVGEAAKGYGVQLMAATAAGAAFIKFGKDALKAAEDQARADRQLEAVAGNLTNAFKAQASALQGTLGVSDDMVQKMQTMLLTYGEAPASVDKTVRAMLDYSARTGIDAVSATQKLITSVESGSDAFKGLGLTYEKTGHRSKDLEAISEALRLKIGGTAERDANSVTGAAARASEAFGEVQETFGGMIATFVNKTHVLEALKRVLEDINKGIGGDDKFNRDQRWAELQDRFANINEVLAKYDAQGIKDGTARAWVEEDRKNTLEEIQRIEAESRAASSTALPSTTPGGVDDRTMKQIDSDKKAFESASKHAEDMERLRKQNEKDMRDYYKSLDEMDLHAQAFDDAKTLERLENSNRLMEIGEKERDTLLKMQEEKLKADKDIAKAVDTENEKAYQHHKTMLDKQEKEWEQAGAAIGQAFTSALTSAIDQMSAGGEVDTGEMIGDILAGVLAVAGTAVGSAFGGPVGGAVGGMIGGLAGSGIKALTRRRHDGGWVEGERYHSGSWIGTDEETAILQAGERVLSRPEVSAMGGKSGVDAALRGGGGGGANITVQTLDGSTTREFFERQGGRALLNAVRTGRGAPSLLFGGG